MATTQWNAKDCTVMWDGINITGLGEDMITGEKDEEFFSSTVGAQGDVVINEINNDLGTITVTVQGTCPQKAKLIADAKAGKVAPLWVNNAGIGEKIGGSKARIKNYPSLEYGQELADREFEFQVFDYTVE